MACTLGSASTSSSASPHSNYCYDVFLNHRGIDVKKTLASHLYRRLLSYGLRVFLDQPELRQGEGLTPQIEGAISSSSVQVAIFSPRYAESRWCFDEFVLMLESKKLGATIIPVFYNVEPSCLRYTNKGVYGEALRIHENKRRYDQQTIANWKAALFEVSNLCGFELDACDGDEGELVDKVAQRVQKRVRKPPLEVAIHPTGLIQKLEDFEGRVLLQQQHSRQSKVVGIVGFGGVGKTTLAKEFFNQKRSEYDRSCFLTDVREAAARSSLTSLQSKLYKDLTGKEQVMHSVDEGTGMLRQPLSCSQALIILDDVDHVDQLLAFLSPRKDVLPSGSLIIVTSRNKEVFTISGIKESSIYKMTGLDEEHSQVLFCLHAFDQRGPIAGFEEVVRKYLKVCAGLPLSLKVIGAQQHGKELQYWEAQLRKIYKSGLPTNIQNRLKISCYDNLEEQEKNIFLDIACFFIGIQRDTAIRIWDGSGWEGWLGLRNLEYKCLVEIDSANCIRMHDHLRDLSRDMAEKETLGCGLRLWRQSDKPFLNVPPQSIVRGISMVQPMDYCNRVVEMSRLQLLSAPGDCLQNIFHVMRHPDLLWFRSDSYSYSSLPSGIPINNLRVVELETLESSLWYPGSEAPLQLRELKIGGTHLRLRMSIGLLKHLEKIELHSVKVTLPEEFFHLRSLKHLKLRAEMMSLPESLGNLTNLQHIDLSWCDNLQTLPSSFGNLRKLQHVNLAECGMLEMLPDSFRNLIRLKHLNLIGCSVLKLSSATLGNISTLERVYVSTTEEMPSQITRQRSLEELSFNCTGLKELPSAIGNLSNLEFLNLRCPSLEILPPSLGNLTNLRKLALRPCSGLKCLPDSIGDLKQLASLTIYDAGIEYLPVGVRELNNLQDLSVQNCPIHEVPFASVEKFQGGRRLLDSSVDKCMLRLRHLFLGKTRIAELSFGEGVCPNLQRLDLSYCDDLVKVGALPTTQISLGMYGCSALKRITGLGGLAKLRQLDMTWCTEVKELPGLETLISLDRFVTSKCENMNRIRMLVEAANPESDILKIFQLRETQETEQQKRERPRLLFH